MEVNSFFFLSLFSCEELISPQRRRTVEAGYDIQDDSADVLVAMRNLIPHSFHIHSAGRVFTYFIRATYSGAAQSLIYHEA